jgi:hypothetical protein
VFSRFVRSAVARAFKSNYGRSFVARLKVDIKAELKAELKAEVRVEVSSAIARVLELTRKVAEFSESVIAERSANSFDVGQRALELRRLVRSTAGLTADVAEQPNAEDLLLEFRFLQAAAGTLRPAFEAFAVRRVLFCGQAYYNAWYLSRALRSLGWKADVYNWDSNLSHDIYYHGQDIQLGVDVPATVQGEMDFYLRSVYDYDVVHFSNAHGISYGWNLHSTLKSEFAQYSEIHLLKALGKKIVYSNNGCLDGVSQTAFAKWQPESVCSICRWQNEPSVCSDERNLAWGQFRNEVADFQCTLGGNRADYNDDTRVHEVPEFYCLDPHLWHPAIEIPAKFLLPPVKGEGIRLYHAVGHREERTRSDGVNIKSTHVYLPLIDKLKAEGISIDMVAPTGVPNRDVRFLQVQADIFLEMLTFGWFGANAREAMMLGKTVICFIRPAWLESVREEIPEYAEELPIVSATPHTIEAVLRELIASPERRREIGQRSREFALKWHSSVAAGKHFDHIYSALLSGDPLLRVKGKVRGEK